ATGSPAFAITMGIVVVALLAANAGCPPETIIRSTFSRTKSAARSGSRSNFPSSNRYSKVKFFPSIQPSLRISCRNASKRGALPEALLLSRKPMRKTFAGCCASARAPHTVSATTIAKSPAHFRFWILDFRLWEEESKNRFQKVLFMQFLQSKIENRQSKMSFYDFVCSRQHVGRNRLTILDFRFWILDCSIIGLLYLLWLRRSVGLSVRSAWPLSH